MHRHQFDRGHPESSEIFDDRGIRQPRIVPTLIGRYLGIPRIPVDVPGKGFHVRVGQLLVRIAPDSYTGRVAGRRSGWSPRSPGRVPRGGTGTVDLMFHYSRVLADLGFTEADDVVRRSTPWTATA